MAEANPYRYIPTICRKYNNQSCTQDDCTHPHVCFKYLNPKSDSNHKGCALNHNIVDPQVKECLRKAGFNISVKASELKDAYVDALMKLAEEKKKTIEREEKPGLQVNPSPRHIVSEIQRLTSSLRLTDVPKVCLNYNQGICTMPQCPLLHICNDYVGRKCKNSFNDCPFNHDITRVDIRNKLRASGLNVNQTPKDLLSDYRAVIQGHLQTLLTLAGQGQTQRDGNSKVKFDQQGKSLSSAIPASQPQKVTVISMKRLVSIESPVLGATDNIVSTLVSESVSSSESEDGDNVQKKKNQKKKKGRGKRQKGKPTKGDPEKTSDRNAKMRKGIVRNVSQESLQFTPDEIGKPNTSNLALSNSIFPTLRSGSTQPLLKDTSFSVRTDDRVSALGSESASSSESEDDKNATKKKEQKKKKGRVKERQKSKQGNFEKPPDENPNREKGIFTDFPQERLQLLTDQAEKSKVSRKQLNNPILSAKPSGFTELPMLGGKSHSTTNDRASALGSESASGSESKDDENAPNKNDQKTKNGRRKQREKGKLKEGIPEKPSAKTPESGKGIGTAVSQENLQFLINPAGKSNASSKPHINRSISARLSESTEHPVIGDRSLSMTIEDRLFSLGSESAHSSEKCTQKERAEKEKGTKERTSERHTRQYR